MSARPLQATDPGTSASVTADAGTGKTWLLVTRLVRLLLGGADPGGLLAVTFTNRAAGEMQARLMDRAREFVTCDDAALVTALERMEVEPTPAARAAARALFERLLDAPWPPRVMTFHAFCQDLLSRFPIEAGVPPAFELLATERELHDAAWQALLDACTGEPDSHRAAALQRLATDGGSLDAAHARLKAFIAHRADWFAWTDGADDPVAFAHDAIALATGFRGDDAREWLTDRRRADIHRFCELIGSAPTAASEGKLGPITALLAEAGAPPSAWCDALDAMTLIADRSKPRDRLVKKSIADRFGTDAVAEVERLQRALIAATADWRLARLNHDWVTVGAALLDHYQRLKAEARVLDFADLEWTACRLLNGTDVAPWVQYRLDRRIDHLLVDEFQDTNPTQWRLIQPLLAEIAAGDAGRPRSAFIVGDPKQSIYGFRRADHRLLSTASALLYERLGAPPVRLEGSRRSAQAVLDCVNAVFAAGSLPLHGFTPHTTHCQDLHGRVEWLAVPTQQADAPAERDTLRDPLSEPRGAGEPHAGLDEAELIADRLRARYDTGTVVGEGADARAFGWDDAMILVRQRTRLASLELALRKRGIPYASDSRGMLLERPEVLDLLALLEFLVAPWNNLQLARLLKSPLFGCADAELLALAPADPDAPARGAWYDRLLALADDGRASATLARAAACLRRWRLRADREPVHDLVDHVFSDGNVLARYTAASPEHLRASVTANLEQVLALALDADAGRYPTLHRLVERLERTRAASAGEREFDDAPVVAADGRVRILTVHSAKGLEAPVVFVAQCDLAPRTGGFGVLVDWPPDEDRPRWMMLARRNGHDTATAAQRAADDERAAIEDANLLYVALTRARQYLFISGRQATTGWYPALAAVFDARDGAPFESGTRADPLPRAPTTSVEPDVALSRAVADAPLRVAPPITVADAVAAERGVLVHAALEHAARPHADLRAVVARIAGRAADDAAVAAAVDAATRVLADPALAWLFDPRLHRHAWSEARLSADDAYGVVDRLVVTDDLVWVVDYKTHEDPLPHLDRLRGEHIEQLRRYAALAGALWPDKPVQSALLFTAIPRLEPLERFAAHADG